jgi:hypothetical protein
MRGRRSAALVAPHRLTSSSDRAFSALKPKEHAMWPSARPNSRRVVTLTGLLLAAFVAPTGIPGSLATADAKVSRIDVERANGRPLAPLPVSSTRPAVAKRWGFQTAVLLGYLGS